MAPRDPVVAAEDVTSQHALHKDDDEAARATGGVALTLWRKARMCAGLMASEAMGVFSYLFVLPLLQVGGVRPENGCRACACVCVCRGSLSL